MASLTRWTWIWASSGSWWWTGKPGVLQSMGSQRVGHDWVTELNWWCLGVVYLCCPPMVLVTTKYIHLFSVHLGAIFQCWPPSWLCSLQLIISSLTCKRNLIRFSGLEILKIYIWMDLVALLIIYLYSVCKYTWWDLPMPLSYRTHSSFSFFLSFQFFPPSLSPTVRIFFLSLAGCFKLKWPGRRLFKFILLGTWWALASYKHYFCVFSCIIYPLTFIQHSFWMHAKLKRAT